MQASFLLLQQLINGKILGKNLPPQMIEFARGQNVLLTNAGHSRVDVSHWQFGPVPHGNDTSSMLPATATLTIGELLGHITDLGFISSQIEEKKYPRIIRMVFQTRTGAQSFIDALKVNVVPKNIICKVSIS
jgi:hypothetical protein